MREGGTGQGKSEGEKRSGMVGRQEARQRSISFEVTVVIRNTLTHTVTMNRIHTQHTHTH